MGNEPMPGIVMALPLGTAAGGTLTQAGDSLWKRAVLEKAREVAS